MGAPSVSVVIVTHDSAGAVGPTLRALAGELGERDEIVVVDNASRDATLAVVAEAAPEARVLAQGRNLGFAAGCNAGAAAARGELLVFLNPDARPQPGFREAIRRPLADGRGWAAWMGLVTAEQGRVINTCGGVVHFTGIAWAGRAGRPVEEAPTRPVEVGFASGACLAVPREWWERAGGFQAGYFMYHEDVELSLRLRLMGGVVGIEPAARVDHDYDFHKGARKWRLLERNRWATLMRTYPAPLLAALAPALLATEVALLAGAVAGGWGRAKVAAWGDLARAWPALRAERRAVQAQRRVGAAEFAAALVPDLDSGYLGAPGRSGALRALLRGYWRAALALAARS